MGLKEDKTITDIVQAVRESDAKKTKGYDTQATVTRVEDGKAWVHIPGGVPETPAELTINAQPGDSVMVRLVGGRAFLLGNATSPPTDDATAREALSNAADALQSAVSAKRAADSAEASAATASAAAQDAVETAEAVHGIAEQAQADAETAKTNAQTAITNAAAAQAAAGAAQTSAANAQRQAASATASANGALNGLSTVQDVIGVLDWAKDNATYTLTSDPDIEPGKTYWTRSGSGTEADPYVYTPVVTPVKADLGTYYEISGVDEAMADFINTHLALTDEGLYVLGGANQWKVLIAPDGVYVINDTGNVVAKYKDVITLGMDDGTESYQRLDYHSMQLVDKEGATYFFVSDLRDRNGVATLTETFSGDGSNKAFKIQFGDATLVSATDSSDPSNIGILSGNTVTFSNVPANGAVITIVYDTTSTRVKAYTLGIRGDGVVGARSFAEGFGTVASGVNSHAEGDGAVASGTISHAEGRKTTASGAYSHAEGEDSVASGTDSHAEGWKTTASGTDSHAEGTRTTASGAYSHAEGASSVASGDWAHAEGDQVSASGSRSHAEGRKTTASGAYSHAEGEDSVASGKQSHAQNYSTIASRRAQTAVGAFNLEDFSSTTTKPGNDREYGKQAFIVGNGSSSARSNAFSVDWDGELNLYIGEYQTSHGHVDQIIYDALNGLGWLSDCTENRYVLMDAAYHGSWVDSGEIVEGRHLYQSEGSYHVKNGWDAAKITFRGYESFSIDIRSYAETNNDYVLVSQLNNDYLANCTSTSAMRAVYNNSTYTKAYTRGKQSASEYEWVRFTGLNASQEYYFYVIYQKDGSVDANDDRGYFYI